MSSHRLRLGSLTSQLPEVRTEVLYVFHPLVVRPVLLADHSHARPLGAVVEVRCELCAARGGAQLNEVTQPQRRLRAVPDEVELVFVHVLAHGELPSGEGRPRPDGDLCGLDDAVATVLGAARTDEQELSPHVPEESANLPEVRDERVDLGPQLLLRGVARVARPPIPLAVQLVELL